MSTNPNKVNSKLIILATQYVNSILSNSGGVYCGHDIQHSIRVYRNAMTIVQAEGDDTCEVNIIAIAALLHDVDDYKFFDTKKNANARYFLKKHNFHKYDTDRICNIINHVSFSNNNGEAPPTLEGKIVQDADRLDAIGAIGIARCFAYGGYANRTIDNSIQHFYDKLLLLKGLMNTDTAKQMAEERHKYMEAFVRQCVSEQDVYDIMH